MTSVTWRIVYVSEVDRLSLNLNSLKVVKGDREVKIPIGDIFAVVVEDLTVTITARLLVELSDNNVLVIFCNQNHLPECIMQPISGHFSQYTQIKEQIDWSEERKANLWKQILFRKIKNQCSCMRHSQVDNNRLQKMEELAAAIELYDQQNIEGQAARYYFNSFFENFTRGDDNLIENAVLNYGYTVMNAAIARTVVAKGLIPAVGIHHIGGRNKFNLASDLIEPFRPLVDLYLLQYPPQEYLTREYRLALVNLLHARVEIDGKMQTVIRAIEIMIQSVIDYFRTGEIAIIKLPKLKRYEFYEL